nr:hypothetical protein CR513_22264 [Ipomoea trifida]
MSQQNLAGGYATWNGGVVLCLRNPGLATDGGATDLISAKFKPLKNGWVFTSAAPRFDPSRFVGSLFSSAEIKSRACTSLTLAGVSLGKAKGFFTMLRSVSSLDAPANGVRPLPEIQENGVGTRADVGEAGGGSTEKSGDSTAAIASEQSDKSNLRSLNFLLQRQNLAVHHFHGVNLSFSAAAEAAEIDSPNIAAADLADQAKVPEAQPPLVAKRVKRRIRRAVGLKRRRVLLRRARGEIERQAAKARAVTVIATTHRTLTGIHALRNINLVGTTINVIKHFPRTRNLQGETRKIASA